MIEKLRQLKKKSHMTNQQIAEKSNIPESTVARIFSGKTPNPTIATVISMARAMGGSAADLLNEDDVKNTEENSEDNPEFIKPDSEGTIAESNVSSERNASFESVEVLSASEDKSSIVSEPKRSGSSEQPSRPLEDITSSEKFYEDIIEFYKSELKRKDAWIARLFWCLIGIMLFILFLLIFDITHPNFGFVKY